MIAVYYVEVEHPGQFPYILGLEGSASPWLSRTPDGAQRKRDELAAAHPDADVRVVEGQADIAP